MATEDLHEETAADAFDLDEDLFDFPPPSEEDEVVEELVEEPAAPLDPEPLPTHVLAEGDFDIDEDIFDFPLLQALDQAPVEDEAGDLSEFESLGDIGDIGSPADLAGLGELDDLGEVFEPEESGVAGDLYVDTDVDDALRSIMEDEEGLPRAADEAEEVESPAAPEPRGPRRKTKRAARKPRKSAAADSGDAPTAVAPRALVYLVAVSVVANLALLVFTWRTSTSIHEGLEGFGQAVVESFQRPQIEAAPPAGNVETQPLETAVPDGERYDPVRRDPIEGSEAVQLRIAQEEMADGEYQHARRRLYRLLAAIDALTGPEHDEIEAAASHLLTETFSLQAMLLREDGR